MFGPLGFWTIALLRCAAKFDPFLSLECARVEGVGAQSKDFALRASGTMAPLRHATKFDPFLSLDCARVEGVGAQSKERKGSNFVA